jgi:NADPH2:quinone reductase
MRAVNMREFGPPDVLVAEDVPEPVPAEREVLIDVQYASITFVETQVRAGRPPHPSMLPALPVILGNGVGGLVTPSAPGVGIAAGTPVVSSLGGSGGYAERAMAGVERLVEVPDGVSLPDGRPGRR